MTTPPMASSTGSLSINANILLCYQIIDDQRNLLGTPSGVDIASNAHIGNLQRQIFKDNKYVLEACHVDAHQLILWKLTTPLIIGHTSPYNMIFSSQNIKEINFPDLQSDEVFKGNGHVQILDPARRLSRYWQGDPGDTHLHLIVQVPLTHAFRTANKRGLEVEDGTAKRARFGGGDDQAHPDIPLDLLNLRRQFWGNPLDPGLTTLPHTVDPESEGEEQLGDLLPGEPFLMDVNPRLLVRAEYIQVFNAAKAVHEEYHDSYLAVVTGQPGIGKTLWILYALRRCLGEKQPVVLYRAGICYFFSELGVDTINPVLHQSGTKHTWCFVDSTYACESLPTSICSPYVQLFPIYVTSPKESHWHKLHQLRVPRLIVMNPWTLDEIEKAATLYPLRKLTDIRERFHNAGPSPRLCLTFDSAAIERFYNSREKLIKKTMTAESIEKLINESEGLLMDDVSHQICLVYRSTPHKMHSYTVDPITPSVGHQLRMQLWRLEENKVLNMLRRFSRVPSGMTGLLFEAHFQRAFAKGIELDAKPMFRARAIGSRWHTKFGDFSANPRLQKAHSEAVSNMDSDISLHITPTHTFAYNHMDKRPHEQLTVEEGVYYVPLADNEVAIDSLILHDRYLYLFQFSGGSTHSIKLGLQDVLNRFSGLPPRANWCFIFVVPQGLTSFNCPHSDEGFLKDHVPYIAQVAVSQN